MIELSGKWKILSVQEFDEWNNELDEGSQLAILEDVKFLSLIGPELGRPYVDTINESKHKNLKELRTKFNKHVYRIFFAFDSKRKGILLIGGDKRGNKRFYKEMVPMADKIYDKYIK